MRALPNLQAKSGHAHHVTPCTPAAHHRFFFWEIGLPEDIGAEGIWRRLGRHGVSDEANLAKGPFAVRAATGIRCATVPHANPWTLSLVERDLEREREREKEREEREREREREAKGRHGTTHGALYCCTAWTKEQKKTEKLHGPKERLVGIHIAAQPGLKVLLSNQVASALYRM